MILLSYMMQLLSIRDSIAVFRTIVLYFTRGILVYGKNI